MQLVILDWKLDRNKTKNYNRHYQDSPGDLNMDYLLDKSTTSMLKFFNVKIVLWLFRGTPFVRRYWLEY